MFIPDPGSWLWIFFHPGSGGQKAPDPGSGSVTLDFPASCKKRVGFSWASELLLNRNVRVLFICLKLECKRPFPKPDLQDKRRYRTHRTVLKQSDFFWPFQCRLMSEGEYGRIVRNSMVEALWQDCDTRAKSVGDMAASVR
jgi:hypothetical protein